MVRAEWVGWAASERGRGGEERKGSRRAAPAAGPPALARPRGQTCWQAVAVSSPRTPAQQTLCPRTRRRLRNQARAWPPASLSIDPGSSWPVAHPAAAKLERAFLESSCALPVVLCCKMYEKHQLRRSWLELSAGEASPATDAAARRCRPFPMTCCRSGNADAEQMLRGTCCPLPPLFDRPPPDSSAHAGRCRVWGRHRGCVWASGRLNGCLLLALSAGSAPLPQLTAEPNHGPQPDRGGARQRSGPSAQLQLAAS